MIQIYGATVVDAILRTTFYRWSLENLIALATIVMQYFITQDPLKGASIINLFGETLSSSLSVGPHFMRSTENDWKYLRRDTAGEWLGEEQIKKSILLI